MTRIALIEPLGDLGIGTYTHELAEALVETGAEVDVFTSGAPAVMRLPRRHSLFPVLGSALIRQRNAIRDARTRVADSRPGLPDMKPPALTSGSRLWTVPRYLSAARETYLSVELALWLRAHRYDVVWTQWPSPPVGGVSLWSVARALRLHLVHTAHNVFPHERSPADRDQVGHIYRWCDRIVVHSQMARNVLAREFPFASDKLVVGHHGLYNVYPRRPDGRNKLRAKLGVPPATTLVLFYGGVRPYKNIEAVIEAIGAERSGDLRLLVAGRESGYPDSNERDPLLRTRRLVGEANAADRVYLMPGAFDYAETADMFEAADAVALPYLESWGSGLLCLAMSFGKPVIVTRTGGMDEYVEDYGAGEVINAPSADEVLGALLRIRKAACAGKGPATRPPHLEWRHIARQVLTQILD